LRGILFHLGKRELKLLKHGMPFRGLSELLVPELFDRELHLLDQQLTGADFGLHVARLCFRLQARRLRGDHHRLERRDVVGERISGGRHKAIAAHMADLASLNRRPIHNVAQDSFSPQLAGARCAAAAANRFLPTNIRVALA
jgi:hypothetical protein